MRNLFLILSLLTSVLAMAQTTVKMTTQKQVGDEFTLMVNSDLEGTIDWGDGKPVPISYDDNQIIGTVLGKAVTIKSSNLTYLDCSSQELSGISFTNAATIETLIMSDNHLSFFSATPLTGLKNFWCDNNEFTTLYIKNLTNLETLVASDNAITAVTMPTNGVSTLTDFWVNNNKMSTLNLKGCTSLRTLNVENNEMTKMTLAILDHKAEQVFLDGNSLDVTSLWNKTNATNWYGTTQTFSFAQDSYKVGEQFSWDRNLHGDNQDGSSISYTNLTYTWYPFTDGEKGDKLTRGNADNQDADYSTPNIGVGKNIFTFNKPFDDVQLEIKCNRFADFFLVSDHIAIIDDETGLNALSVKNNLQFTPERGAITLKADAATPVRIYNALGHLVWNGDVLNPTRINLPKGIYFVNKIKVSL